MGSGGGPNCGICIQSGLLMPSVSASLRVLRLPRKGLRILTLLATAAPPLLAAVSAAAAAAHCTLSLPTKSPPPFPLRLSRSSSY
ncbi:unnamed protein product [Citrullus colocynthis]|uniref:Uncharacterized protein n=1 Tax=Citrullus colocynthis TaxID=252529 RepID=A0ABP0YK77_9ROSI